MYIFLSFVYLYVPFFIFCIFWFSFLNFVILHFLYILYIVLFWFAPKNIFRVFAPKDTFWAIATIRCALAAQRRWQRLSALLPRRNEPWRRAQKVFFSANTRIRFENWYMIERERIYVYIYICKKKQHPPNLKFTSNTEHKLCNLYILQNKSLNFFFFFWIYQNVRKYFVVLLYLWLAQGTRPTPSPSQ